MSNTIKWSSYMVAPTEIKKVKQDGKDVIKVKCPWCGVFAIADDDMFHGKVSMDCPCCYYHETHNISHLLDQD